MKKRLGRKLILNKETLRNLSDRDMGPVAGARTLTCGAGGCSDTNTLQQSECIHVTCGPICQTLDC